MADRFRIGKHGPTTLQGGSAPLDSSGSDGDLYILMGSSPCLYQKTAGVWLPCSDPSFSTVRQAVVSGSATLDPKTTYCAVTGVAGATLTLPSGRPNQQVTIK